MMNSEIGFAAKVLEVLSRHGISFEHLPSGIDTMSVVIDNKYLENDDLGAILEEIREAVRPDHIYTHENIALVATVGHAWPGASVPRRGSSRRCPRRASTSS